MRLSKATKEFNIATQRAVDTLKEHGHVVEASPNAKIDDAQYEILKKVFASDKAQKDEAEKLFPSRREEKRNEKGDKAEADNQPTAEAAETEAPAPAAAEQPQPAADDAAPADATHAPENEENNKPRLKVVGHIDLEATGPGRKRTSRKSSAAAKSEKSAAEEAPATAPATEKAAAQAQAVQAPAETPAPAAETGTTPAAESTTASAAPAATAGKQVEKPAEAPSETAEAPASEGNAEDTPAVGGAPRLTGPKVLGKIDLDAINANTRPKKKSKEELRKERNEKRNPAGKKRARIGNERVDVSAEAKKNNAGAGNGAGGNQNRNNQNRNDRNAAKGQGKKGKKGNAPAQPVSDEDVAKQVKETLARLQAKGAGKGKGAKYRKEKREAARERHEEDLMRRDAESRVLKLTEFVTANELATMMDVPVTQVIGTCMSIGIMVSINQRLDQETIEMVADEFGFSTEFVSAEVQEAIVEEVDSDEDLVPRAHIVTVMGHVDHGKTSLLDHIRNANVIAGEAGGITQHIGAYNVRLKNGREITFLDTPGHEAFTAMRARGAQVTDIAIIIIAADDNVMPQTKEAINHAVAAGVPIVFAINKVDKPAANPDRIREQLAAMNYLVEEWGGKYQCQEISAKQGLNIDALLEKVLLEAELLELKANPKRRAVGSIIESSLDKGRGYVAKILVQNGTLAQGDVVLAGTHYGRVKAMFNERDQKVMKAGPSEPVLILGLDGAPTAGETFNVMESEQEARSIASKREQLKREQDNRTKKGLTLDELARRRALGNFQELNVIIKGDVDGSIEALSDSLIRLSTQEIQVNVIHKGVGQISESDVVLASASSAIILGFQVRPSQAARRLADREGVEIRTYSIIYDTIEDIKSAMEGMLSPEIKENIVANLEVQQTFKITKVGTIAGCMVIDGKIKRNNKIRLIRDGIVKYAGELGSLKRYKDDAKEVVMGQECGLNIEGYNDIMVGDIIEAYEEIELKKTLDSIS